MKSPFDQNAEQEPSSQQSYEKNLSRDYAPSERAKVRALDQRAAFNEATLKQRAEAAGANAEIARSRLGLTEQRMGLVDIQSQIAQEKAELANNDSKAKAMRELTVTREANGFLRDAIGMDPNKPEFDEQYQKMLAGYQNAPESKAVQEWITAHVPIAKSRKEREDLIAKEKRATDEKIATEGRAADAAATERTRLQGIAKDIPISQVVSDGVTYKKPDLPKPKEEIPDTYVKYNADLAAARKSLGIPVAQNPEEQIPLPFDIQKQFEARGTALTKGKATLPTTEQPQAPVGNPNSMPAPAAPAAAELKQYASEEDARKNGAKAGDIIILINPKTGKPGRARLD